MCSIGVIGDYDSICGFSAVGFDVFPVESIDQARTKLNTLASGGCGIIYITEPFMEQLQPECAQYDEHLLPCVIPIPAQGGAAGFGQSRLNDWVKRAVGSDIA